MEVRNIDPIDWVRQNRAGVQWRDRLIRLIGSCDLRFRARPLVLGRAL